MSLDLFNSESSSELEETNQNAQGGDRSPNFQLDITRHKSSGDLTINNTTVDAGAFDLAETAIIEQGILAGDAVGDSLGTVREGIYSNEIVVGEALDFGRRALDTVDEPIISNENIIRDSIAATVANTARAFGLAADFATETRINNERNNETFERISRESIDAVASSTDAVLTSLENVDESRSLESQTVLEKVSELATVVQTGGESITQGINKTIGVAALVVVGFIAWGAVNES